MLIDSGGVMGDTEHSQSQCGGEVAGAEDGPTEEDTVVRPSTLRHHAMGKGAGRMAESYDTGTPDAP